MLVTVSTNNGHGARCSDMVGAKNAGSFQTVNENVLVCELTLALAIDLSEDRFHQKIVCKMRPLNTYNEYLVRVEEKLLNNVPSKTSMRNVDFGPLVGNYVGGLSKVKRFLVLMFASSILSGHTHDLEAKMKSCDGSYVCLKCKMLTASQHRR